jgi:hypothetical protein
MLTLAKCREFLGDAGSDLSDEQVLALRDQLYALADVITDMYEEQHQKKQSKRLDSPKPEWN